MPKGPPSSHPTEERGYRELFQQLVDLSGWKQVLVAEKLGVSEGLVSQYLRGDTSVAKGKLEHLRLLVRLDFELNGKRLPGILVPQTALAGDSPLRPVGGEPLQQADKTQKKMKEDPLTMKPADWKATAEYLITTMEEPYFQRTMAKATERGEYEIVQVLAEVRKRTRKAGKIYAKE